MVLKTFLLMAVLSQSPSMDWDKGVHDVDLLLKEQRGIGMVMSLEIREANKLTYQYLQRGGSDSPWKLEVLPIDSKNGRPGKGDECSFMGGGVPHFAKPIVVKFAMPQGTQKIIIRFRTAQFKGLARTVDLPLLGTPAKIVVLHLPEL